MRFSRAIATVAATGAVLAVTVATAAANHGPDLIPEPIPESGIEIGLETLADGFTTPLWAINAPGDNKRIFVVDQVGTITALAVEPGKHHDVPDRLEVLDVGADGLDLLVPLGAFGPGTFDERGLLGLAFHPDYRKNGLVYTYTSEPVSGPADFSTMPAGETANSQSVVREWRVPDPKRATSIVDPASTRVLLTIDQPQFNHNAGALVFGKDDHLYVAVGDGGAADDQGPGHAPGGNGQDLSEGNVLGKILRIDPLGSSSENGQYGVPSSNPFVGEPAPDEIYAYGFRNPFRMSVDQRTGELIAADVGQVTSKRSTSSSLGATTAGRVKEGSFLFDMNGDDPGFASSFSPGQPAGMIDPIAEYDHDEGVSVTGGFVYRGSAVRQLRGSYVFGDFTQSFAGPGGRLFHLDDTGDIAELVASNRAPLAMSSPVSVRTARARSM